LVLNLLYEKADDFLDQTDTKNLLTNHFYGGTMKLLNTLLSLSLIAGAAMSLTACTDQELAFGAGAVVGVIIGDGGDHHHNQPNPPRYRRGGRWHAENVVVLSPAETVALKYDLTQEQAEVLTAHLLPAQQGDLSGLAALGFDRKDLEALMAGKNPSASTLLTIGQTLGLDMAQAHNLIQNIKADAMIARAEMN
jgi:DNA-binding phage protein